MVFLFGTVLSLLLVPGGGTIALTLKVLLSKKVKSTGRHAIAFSLASCLYCTNNHSQPASFDYLDELLPWIERYQANHSSTADSNT